MSERFSSTFYGALAVSCGFVAIVIAITANFFITQAQIHNAVQSQQSQGQMLEGNLCHTLNTLKAQKPPSGKPGTNPSRAYLQQLHVSLAELAADIGCPSIPAVRP